MVLAAWPAFCGLLPKFSHSVRLNLPNYGPEVAARSLDLVRILLQHKTTLHYVESAAGWTPYVDKAHVFGTGLEAITFCLTHQLGNMQILGKFTDTRMNFTVPVTDLRAG